MREGNAVSTLEWDADPVRLVMPAVQEQVGGKTMLVESQQELLTNKLVAMLSRFELRDQSDARALMKAGANLDSRCARRLGRPVGSQGRCRRESSSLFHSRITGLAGSRSR